MRLAPNWINLVVVVFSDHISLYFGSSVLDERVVNYPETTFIIESVVDKF